MGSVYYISPEQAQGHELDESSDLYSVGIVIYQMFTGKLPFTGESPVTVALKHIGDPVPVLDRDRDRRRARRSPRSSTSCCRRRRRIASHRLANVATALREARERPSVANYSIADDAPTQMTNAVLPPRRSPLPDRTYTSIGEDEERRSRIGAGFIGVLVALALGATLVGYLVFGRGLTLPASQTQITVADYTNESDTQAQQDAVNAGLIVRIIKSPSDTVPANHVIRQNPQAGSKVDRNSLVELVVSNGLPLVGLPDVRAGYNVDDARRTLQDDGFTVKTTQRYSNTPKDSIVDQKPGPRAKVRKG